MGVFRLLDISLEELIFLMMEPTPHPSAWGWELPKPFRDPWKLGKNVDPVDPRPLFPLSLWNQQRPLRFTANEIFLASLPLRRLEQRNSLKKTPGFSWELHQMDALGRGWDEPGVKSREMLDKSVDLLSPVPAGLVRVLERHLRVPGLRAWQRLRAVRPPETW